MGNNIHENKHGQSIKSKNVNVYMSCIVHVHNVHVYVHIHIYILRFKLEFRMLSNLLKRAVYVLGHLYM